MSRLNRSIYNINKIYRQGYASAAEVSGLKAVSKFNKNTALSLRSIMTLKMWCPLKRVFTDEVGWDVFGSVDAM